MAQLVRISTLASTGSNRRRVDRIEALGGELAPLVTSGVITVAEAERRADEAGRLARIDADQERRRWSV